MANFQPLSRQPTFEDEGLLNNLLSQQPDSYEDQDDEGVDEPPSRHPEWDQIIKEIKEVARKRSDSKEASNLASKLEKDKTWVDALGWTSPDGSGFLHYLLQSREAAKCCKQGVMMPVVAHNPKSIERAIDGDEHPLTLAIAASCDTLIAVMIYQMQKRLCTRLLKNGKGEGKRCIKAAFDALRSNRLNLVAAHKLVDWASESMLEGVRTEDHLSPLHVAVMFDQGIANAKVQPELVKLLLKRHETSIHDRVKAGTYKTSTGEITVNEPITVYEWHQRTAEHFRGIMEKQLPSTPDKTSQGNTTVQRQGQHQQSRNPSERKISENLHRRQSLSHTPADGLNSNGTSLKVASNEEGSPAQNRATGVEKEQVPIETNDRKFRALGQTQPHSNRKNGPKTKADPDNLRMAEGASNIVKLELQESYLRATISTPEGGDVGEVSEKDETDIKKFFGNDMQDVEIGLHLGNQPQGEPMTEESIRKFFKDTKFNSILAYVSLPQAPVKLSPAMEKPAPPQPQYHDERLFYFHWLHEEKKVNKILKLIVDDTKRPHRDEVIEEAIRGLPSSKDGLTHNFEVEILKWRKIDLDPMTILQAAPNTMELHLDWSGNNVALRGWSAPDGLPQLKQLRQVHLTYTQDVESSRRMLRNIGEFQYRLSKCRAQQNELVNTLRDKSAFDIQSQGRQTQNQTQEDTQTLALTRGYPEIKVIKDPRMEGGAGIPPLSSVGRTSEPKHKWINYMKEFVSFLPELPNDMERLKMGSMASKRVTVALIDDGVDVFTSGLAPFSDRFIPGVSFDRSSDRHSSREWSSRGGHGTLMAKLILAVCPYADIVTYRVLMRPDKETGMLTPDAQSAAKAIKDAVERNVDIISMSWTVSKPESEADKGFDRLNNIMVEAVGPNPGNRPVPLLFCAAADDGIHGNNGNLELPSGMNWKGIFCIGAATNALQTWVKVTNPNERHFFFPGVDVPDLRQHFQYAFESPETDPYSNSGSSIACALAAGQAALILHCFKLSIYYTKRAQMEQRTRLQEQITENDLKRVKQFTHMREAFAAVCTVNNSNHKVLYPAYRFEKATDVMRKLDERGRPVWPEMFEPIVSLVRNLIGWRD